MKKIFKLFIYFLFFILFLLIFLPKESIYNFIEQELSKQNIIISNETRDEKLLSLDIKNAKVFYEGIEGVNIKDINFLSLLVYSKISVKNLEISKSLSSFFPGRIKNIELKHSVLDYKNIIVSSLGDFGVLNGTINLINRTITLKLKSSSKMKREYSKVLRSMKLKDGEYIYEYRF